MPAPINLPLHGLPYLLVQVHGCIYAKKVKIAQQPQNRANGSKH